MTETPPPRKAVLAAEEARDASRVLGVLSATILVVVLAAADSKTRSGLRQLASIEEITERWTAVWQHASARLEERESFLSTELDVQALRFQASPGAESALQIFLQSPSRRGAGPGAKAGCFDLPARGWSLFGAHTSLVTKSAGQLKVAVPQPESLRQFLSLWDELLETGVVVQPRELAPGALVVQQPEDGQESRFFNLSWRKEKSGCEGFFFFGALPPKVNQALASKGYPAVPLAYSTWLTLRRDTPGLAPEMSRSELIVPVTAESRRVEDLQPMLLQAAGSGLGVGRSADIFNDLLAVADPWQDAPLAVLRRRLEERTEAEATDLKLYGLKLPLAVVVTVCVLLLGWYATVFLLSLGAVGAALETIPFEGILEWHGCFPNGAARLLFAAGTFLLPAAALLSIFAASVLARAPAAVFGLATAGSILVAILLILGHHRWSSLFSRRSRRARVPSRGPLDE